MITKAKRAAASVYGTTSFSVCSRRRTKMPIIYPGLRLAYEGATQPDLESDLVQNCEDVFLLCWIDAPPIHGPRGIVLGQG
jgi:hypothetical protein